MGERGVCLLPRVSGIGGMVSFQHKLIAGLAQRGVKVSQEPDAICQAALVIGGTRHLRTLRGLQRRGVPVIQRLNGMNWLHRWGGRRRSGIKHYLRAEYGNWLLRTIRNRIADRVVYQSEFARGWWERVYGAAPVPAHVIFNGVDLDIYSPLGSEGPPEDRWRVLMVEGSLMGGYEQGMEAAVDLIRQLHSRLYRSDESSDALSMKTAEMANAADRPQRLPLELMVVGQALKALRQRWNDYIGQYCPPNEASIHWMGPVNRDQIPALDRTAHLLYASDINAACPNSVIEGLACGLPVLSFDTGALPEMVPTSAGRVVPYGADPWNLEPPDMDGLVSGAATILNAQAELRAGARRQAEQVFGLDRMVETYLDVLFES